jgi:hypothetical protein
VLLEGIATRSRAVCQSRTRSGCSLAAAASWSPRFRVSVSEVLEMACPRQESNLATRGLCNRRRKATACWIKGSELRRANRNGSMVGDFSPTLALHLALSSSPLATWSPYRLPQGRPTTGTADHCRRYGAGRGTGYRLEPETVLLQGQQSTLVGDALFPHPSNTLARRASTSSLGSAASIAAPRLDVPDKAAPIPGKLRTSIPLDR